MEEGLVKGRNEGIAQGLAQGRSEGRTEGIAIGEARGRERERSSIFEKLIATGMDRVQAASITGVALT